MLTTLSAVRGEHDARDDRADALTVNRRDESARGESHERQHRDVEGDALKRAMLGKLNDRRRRQQQQRAGGPAEENDRCDREHEGERQDTAAGLRIDRHREPLRQRRRRGERGQADAVRARYGTCVAKTYARRRENSEPCQADRENQRGEPARRDRLSAHGGLNQVN